MEELIKNLEKRKLVVFSVLNKDEARAKVLELIKSGDSVGWGGSVTLKECGILDGLAQRGVNKLYDRNKAQSPEEKDKVQRDIFFSDWFLLSANAVLTDGRIINIDGKGNRVAASIFGPKRTIYVIGKNKIVNGSLDDGIMRVKNYASPPNTKRLEKKTTGCYVTGKCTDCSSDERICRNIHILEWSKDSENIVILVDEELGY